MIQLQPLDILLTTQKTKREEVLEGSEDLGNHQLVHKTLKEFKM